MTKRTSRKPKRSSRKRTSRRNARRSYGTEYRVYPSTVSSHYRTFYTRAAAEKHVREIEGEYPNASIAEMPMRNGKRRRSRPNQTFYYLSPGPARNPRLSKKRRSKLPASKFVFPKDRAWPIESAKGARDAIKYIRMGRVRNASDYMAIRSFIIKHYPAVWRKDGLAAGYAQASAAKKKGMAHRARTVAAKHRKAAN